MAHKNFNRSPYRAKPRNSHDYSSLEAQLHAVQANQAAEQSDRQPPDEDPYAKLPFVAPYNRRTVGRAFASIPLEAVRSVFDRKTASYHGTKPKANDNHLVYIGADVLYPNGRQGSISVAKIMKKAAAETGRNEVYAGMFEPVTVPIAGVEFVPQKSRPAPGDATKAIVRVVFGRTARLEDEYRALRQGNNLGVSSIAAVQSVDIATVSGGDRLIRADKTAQLVSRALRDVIGSEIDLQPLAELAAPVTYSNTRPPADQIRYEWSDRGYGPVMLDGTPLSQPDHSTSNHSANHAEPIAPRRTETEFERDFWTE